MSKTLHLSPLAGIQVVDIHRDGASWIVEATGSNRGTCPSCGAVSTVRHGLYRRSLQDLPAQGASVTIKLAVTRFKCLHQQCVRRTFSGCTSNEIVRNARRTSRVAEIASNLTAAEWSLIAPFMPAPSWRGRPLSVSLKGPRRGPQFV